MNIDDILFALVFLLWLSVPFIIPRKSNIDEATEGTENTEGEPN